MRVRFESPNCWNRQKYLQSFFLVPTYSDYLLFHVLLSLDYYLTIPI